MSDDRERHAASVCPGCRTVLDCSTPVGETMRVEPGAVSICAYCGAVGVFNEDLTLRAMTPEEVLEAPPEFLRKVAHIRQVIRTVRAQKN